MLKHRIHNKKITKEKIAKNEDSLPQTLDSQDRFVDRMHYSIL